MSTIWSSLCLTIVFSRLFRKFFLLFTVNNYCSYYPFSPWAHHFSVSNVAGKTWISPWYFLVFRKYFNNLLCKLFSERDGGSWVVKLSSRNILFFYPMSEMPCKRQNLKIYHLESKLQVNFHFSEKKTIAVLKNSHTLDIILWCLSIIFLGPLVYRLTINIITDHTGSLGEAPEFF